MTNQTPEKPAAHDDENQVLVTQKLSLAYDQHTIVKNVELVVGPRSITALIGPSGCGKSTLLRTFNRMNDFIPAFRRVSGTILYRGMDIYASDVDPVYVRRRVGMVFQKPNPFASSIYKNITWGPSINGFKGDFDELVEASLKRAALWDEVKDKLNSSGLALSGGQQQRLCIARAIAMDPDVILMDEPCSALDPASTSKIEDLMSELKQKYSILIVTHNMQQAARASDQTALMFQGDLIEQGPTRQIFNSPKNKITEDYIMGRFG
ncbi:MAG: phosphate ABC transporter ATP-binding protein PstB [Proteobacteria bacterium]|nr:phosphate ABC transporter ATP-binding protein PstB [Pseudomonadota bacterium]